MNPNSRVIFQIGRLCLECWWLKRWHNLVRIPCIFETEHELLFYSLIILIGGIICLSPPINTEGGGRLFFFTGVNGVRWKSPVTPGDDLIMEMSLVNFDERLGFASMTGKAYVGGRVSSLQLHYRVHCQLKLLCAFLADCRDGGRVYLRSRKNLIRGWIIDVSFRLVHVWLL